MTDVVIAGAARTAVGAFNGGGMGIAMFGTRLAECPRQ